MKKDMIIEKIEISKLKPAKYNPRQITKKQYNDLKDSLDTADEKLGRFLDAKVKNITIPFETEEFTNVVNRLEVIMNKYNCQDYRELIYKVIENEKV